MAEQQANAAAESPTGNSNGLESDVLSEAELEELKKTLAEQEAKEEARMKELELTCQRQIESKMETINSQITQSFKSRMTDFGERYETHAQQSISTRQIDVLRVNKIIREVARGLGTEWKLVFLLLMKDLVPLEEAQEHVAKIEQQKPFMQAYKALQLWKETVGEEFYVMNLVNALNESDRQTLASHVMDIVECSEPDTLMAMSDLGRKGSVGGGSGEKTEDGEAGRKASVDSRKGSATEDMEGPLGDRKFLKIARKLGPAWLDLGKALSVPEDELGEIRAAEDGYQAAFKLLWAWRDNFTGTEAEGAAALTKALQGIGKEDLAQIISPPAAS